MQDHFEAFEQVYEERFERQYWFVRPYISHVIYRYLDCGDLHNGFALVGCEDCGHEYLLAFSCQASRPLGGEPATLPAGKTQAPTADPEGAAPIQRAPDGLLRLAAPSFQSRPLSPHLDLEQLSVLQDE